MTGIHQNGLNLDYSKGMAGAEEAGKRFSEAVAIMARLRGPEGCPWDREQDFHSIRKYTLEEVYEVFDAIETENRDELRSELGDLLLQVLFYAQMAAEPGYFTIADVIEALNLKLIRRHPHVFGDEAAAAAGNRAEGMETSGIDAGQVLRNWEEIKKQERRQQAGTSRRLLDEVPRSLPSLMEAAKLGSRAAKVGFDWPELQGLLAKVREETAEVEAEIAEGKSSERVAEEIGDLLFTVANLARHLKVDPELSLRDANAKFRRRFAQMEEASAKPLEQRSAEELEALWAAAKRSEQAEQVR
jgi:ATP diphosphatase